MNIIMRKLLIFCFSISLCHTSRSQSDTADRLQNSPRHQEWITLDSDNKKLRAFVVYPEVSTKAPVVIVIHENRGLNDWAKSVADQFAEKGYIAIAPDLLSGKAPGSGNTADFADPDKARDAIYSLTAGEVTRDLNTIFTYARTLPAGNEKIAVAGFCWGGSQAFRYATNQPELEAALVFYGTGPADTAAIEAIEAPVYGFYGGNDARVNATIEESKKLMEAAGNTYEPVIYDGAGHGFMRSGEEAGASADNKKGRQEAWQRVEKILAQFKEEQ